MRLSTLPRQVRARTSGPGPHLCELTVYGKSVSAG
jgi:hypothetical protein